MGADGGFVRVYRSLFDNPVFRSDGEAMAFAYLVAKASWRDTKQRYKERLISLRRGQLALSIRDFANAMERDRNWAERFIKRLRDRDMIETATETGVNIITICNYDEYQGSARECETGREQLPRQDRDTEQRKEEFKKKEREPIGSPKKAFAWPPDTPPPAEWIEYAVQRLGWRRTDAQREAEKFINRALAKRVTNVDWFAAWRNWTVSDYQQTKAPGQQVLTL